MSFIAAPALFDDTPSDLKMASFPAHRAANEEAGEHCEQRYVISASMKLRSTKVGSQEGTEEINSIRPGKQDINLQEMFELSLHLP